MDNAGYIGLSRQTGLMRELNTIANNLANMNTNGYRREGSIFAEHVKSLQGGDPSLSIATMNKRFIDTSAGDVTVTGGSLDLALEGQGFFLVETPAGERLTRDGAFSLNAERALVSTEGFRVLDESGGAIVIPPDQDAISVTSDGSIVAGGRPIAKLSVVTADSAYLVREGGNVFRAEKGFEPVENARVQQGALEGSNVNPVEEIARLIKVQRTYEASKNFSENENERISKTIRTLGRAQ